MENRTNFDLKYIIKQNIERVWGFVRDPNMFNFYMSDPYYKCEILKGKILWEEGSKYITLRRSDKSPNQSLNLSYTCLSSVSESYYKCLVFSITINDCLTCKEKISLYHVSSDDFTVILYEFYEFSDENSEYIEILKDLTPHDVSKLDSFLQTSAMDFFQYEGIVFDLTVDLFWEKINDFKLIKKFFPLHIDSIGHIKKDGTIDFQCSFKDLLKVGEIFRVTYLKENRIYFTIKEVVFDKTSIKREILLSFLNTGNYIIKELKFTFIQIDKNKSHFSICHFYTTPDTPQNIKKLSEVKIKTLMNIKKNIEL